jgi:putative ABC transport system substrate-binding protein
VTGLSSAITESFPKRVELLGELLPGLKRIAAILNMGNAVVPPQWSIIEASARSLGITAHLFDVRRPEDLPGHSMPQRSCVPRRSSWDSTAS